MDWEDEAVAAAKVALTNFRRCSRVVAVDAKEDRIERRAAGERCRSAGAFGEGC